MNNTHKSIEPSKNEEELHFCNWAAMGAELQPKTLSFFNFNKNSQNPFNTILATILIMSREERMDLKLFVKVINE